jgi:two-component system sensor histidine kinase BaeS
MKLGLTFKLFLAILFTNIAIAAAVGIAVRVSFSTGFMDYVKQREGERLAVVASKMAEAYRQHADWEFVRNNDALWQLLSKPEGRPTQRAAGQSLAPPTQQPGIHQVEFELKPEAVERLAVAQLQAPIERMGPPVPALLDARGALVVGQLDAAQQRLTRPIVVDGTVVGWLTGGFMGEPLKGADLRFQQQQRKASWLIGGLAIALAAAAALFLARSVLAPLRRLTSATHRLAAGDYAARVTVAARDEIGALVENFNRLAAALGNSEQMRRDHMADISHELRTPLAVMRGELQALEDQMRSLTHDSLKSLQQQASTLNKLVDDLYDLSLAEAGAVRYRSTAVDIVELVRMTLLTFRLRLSNQRIALQTELPEGGLLFVSGDPDRLRQLLNNLLENSSRYTDPGGALRVAIDADRGQLRLDIQDSQPGLAAALLPRIFERSFRGDSARGREGGGAGLGLSVCRQIVAAHGGEISAKPSPLGGVWIQIVLPLMPRHAHH